MTAPRHVTVGNITIGNDRPLALIAGPCALESRAHAREMCHALTELTGRLGIGLIYKTSFDKANRTSADTPRGLRDGKGPADPGRAARSFGCPVLTDVHEPLQCAPVAEAVDVLQIRRFYAGRPIC
jgi:2-dehydro-3-deoxyphosphooctonate aldolase (KDO 8-P synthase)